MKGTGIQLEQRADGSVDLAVGGGAIGVGGVTEQNQWLLLSCRKGEIREYPLVGVGIGDMANDHDWDGWKREISLALEADGQRVELLELNANRLKLTAKYK